jgi:hypothetical protein
VVDRETQPSPSDPDSIDSLLRKGQTILSRYRRDAHRTWEDAERNWQRFKRSPLSRMPYFRHWVCAHRGEAALLRGSDRRAPGERKGLIEVASQMAAALPAAGRTGLPLRAALAYQRGEVETAAELLRTGARKMPLLWAQAAQRRLGA